MRSPAADSNRDSFLTEKQKNVQKTFLEKQVL